MRAASLPTRCSANWATTVRTASACPSRLASPQPTTPSWVSIRTNNHRGGTRKVSTLLIGPLLIGPLLAGLLLASLLAGPLLAGMEGASFGDDGDDLVDQVFGTVRYVDGRAGFVSRSLLEIVELRSQERRR